MRKLLLALLLLLPTTAFASTQVVIGGNVTYTTGTSIQYFGFGFGVNGAYNGGAIPGVRPFMPVGGTVSTMRVSLVNPPGAGTSYAFTLYKGNSATSLTCTIADTATSCTDLTDSISVAAGDNLSWQVSPTNSPIPIAPAIATNFTPTNPGDTFIMSTAGNNNTTFNAYSFPSTSGGWGTTENSTVRTIIPDAGTLDQFYMQIQTAPGTGSTLYAVRTNSATSTVQCSISTTGKTCSDTTDTLAVSTADIINYVSAPSGITTANGVSATSWRFRSTALGDFLFYASSGVNPDGFNTTPEFLSISGFLATSSESNAQEVTNAMNVTKLAAFSTNAPGTGKSRTYVLRVNGVSTSLTCTIADTNNSCTATGFVHVNDGDQLATMMTPSGTPAGAASHVSYAASTGDNFFMWWLSLLTSLF
jgi:hypothetical protein